jgi:Trk K+ transport system NAD-binding subunit
MQALDPKTIAPTFIAVSADLLLAFYTLFSRTDGDNGIREVVVRNPFHAGKRLHQLRLPGDLLAVAVRRNEDLLLPHGDTRLSLNDCLTLVGAVNDLSQAEEMFASPSAAPRRES